MNRILFIVFLLGLIFRFFLYFHFQHEYTTNPYFDSEITLQEDPEISNNGQTLSIKDTAYKTIFITTSAFPKFHMGQVLHVQGNVKTKVLESGRTIYSLRYPKITRVAEDIHVFSRVARYIRDQTRNIFESTLPPTSARLLMGILFGSHEHFPEAFSQALRNTGVMHIIAASGMNVSFVSIALIFVLQRFMTRRKTLLIASIGVLFYLFLVGMQPSILRATIMALFGFSAGIVGRQQYSIWAVFLSAYSMLLWQPGYLFDLGFQLSFFATIGILCLKPLFTFPQNAFFDVVSTTLAAEIATIPLLFATFGTIGIWGLVVNVLVLWTIPVVMIIASCCALLGLLVGYFAQGIALLALPFLLYVEFIIQFFNDLNGVITDIRIPWEFIAAYYLMLVLLIIQKKTYTTVYAIGVQNP